MSRLLSSTVRVALPLLAGAMVGAAAVVVARTAPEGEGLRRLLREAQGVAERLPGRAEQLLQEAQQRLAQAKEVYQAARVESERALIAQLQEAKQRGSLPPIT